MLTPHQLTIELLARGLLSTGNVVSGGLEIVEVSRRNRNYRITRDNGTGYLVKQSSDDSDTLENEARVYAMLHAKKERSSVANYLPAFYCYEPRRRLLVLQLIRNSHSLSEHLQRHGRIGTAIGAELGRSLAAIHNRKTPAARDAEKPWIFSLSCPRIETIENMSAANLQLVRMVQESRSLCRALDRMAADWKDDVLIHNDARFANVLLHPRNGRRDGWSLRIVDWELAGTGDARWDIGSVFADFIAHWLFAMRSSGSSPRALVRSARFPLRTLQPAMRSFWNAYASSCSWSPSIGREILIESVRFAAARLIQFAYELMQQQSEVTVNVVSTLQTSENMIRRPAAAVSTLFGIEGR